MSRKRQKKIPLLSTIYNKRRVNNKVDNNLTTNLSHNNHNLLHSDKSTYFYKYKCNKLSKRFLYSTVPLGLMALALLLVVGCLISPIGDYTPNQAYAEEENSGSSGTTRSNEGMSVKLALADPDTSVLTNNAEVGKVNYISKGFTVTTSNVEGYNVYVQTAPGSSNKLTNGNISIDFVKTDTPTSEFTDNTWGYAVDSTGTRVEDLRYNPVPDSGSAALDPAYTSSSNGETKDFTLNFAAKFGNNATAGHYTTDIILSVAAGAEEVATSEEFLGFYGINYMQEMTPAICKKARVGETARLIDSRDQKLYWIAKMKDDNCWMVQNLAIDLWEDDPSGETNGEGITLDPESSDVKAAWTSDTGSGSTVWNHTAIATNASKYYNPGDFVLTQPAARPDTSCGLFDTEACAAAGWVDVSHMSASNDPSFGYGIENYTYNAHYLSGNYYSWNAATAGQATSFDSLTTYPINTAQSICPKGWALPERYDTLEDVNHEQSYSKLLTAYGTQHGLKFGNYDMRLAPLYLLQAGFVGSDTMLSLGRAGTYWMKTSSSSNSAYDLGSDTSVSLNGVASIRTWGNTIRCVAR